MDETEQLEAIWNKGIKLAERQDDEHNVSLYQIDGFYVEEFFHKEYKVKIRSFFSTDQLNPYLDKIDITGLEF